MGRLVPNDEDKDYIAYLNAEKLIQSVIEYNKIWYEWIQGATGGEHAPAVISDDKFMTFKKTIHSIIDDSTKLINSMGESILINRVVFTPSKLEIDMKSNEGTATFDIDPFDSTEEIVFEAPDANKGDYTVDTKDKKITIKRNDKAPKWTLTAKGATSGKTVGTLPIEFKVAPPDVDISEIVFNPKSLTVDAGVDSGKVTYTINPENSNETYTFEIPIANKDNVTVDKENKTLTVKRNDKLPEFVIKVIGDRSKKEIGTLNVLFKKEVPVEEVKFNPDKVSADVGTNSVDVTYSVTPSTNTDTLKFVVPDKNKDYVQIDKAKKN